MELAEVVALARARPWAHQPWAKDLVAAFPDILAEAVDRWCLAIEGAHTDGAGLPVLDVRQAERPAVLKFDGVGTDLAQQVRVLEAAGGRGYARVLDHDVDLGAALLERLGPPLAVTTPDPVEQTDTLTALLEQAWLLPLDVGLPQRPGSKARQLLELVGSEQAADHGRSGRAGVRHTPRGAESLARAASLARALADSPADREVVVHGDPHPLNALLRNGRHAFIDPDGFRCEPEYDAGVVLRDLQRPIDHLDAAGGAGVGRRWHAGLVDRVSTRLGLDRERVAAWAFVERVTTGLWLRRLGYTEEGEAWLATAARM